MGQSHSTRHRLLQNAKDVDWESVLSEEWRSEKSRELDKWGGLGRGPVPRGNSMSAKLELLGTALITQGDAIYEELYRKPTADPDAAPRAAGGAVPGGKETERRWELALLKRGKAVPSKQSGALSHEDFSELKSSPASGPVPTVTIKNAQLHRTFVVAAWRVRSWEARRRVMLTIIPALRLLRLVKGPRRMRRINTWAWAVPGALKDKTQRFIEDTQLVAQLRGSIESIKASIERTYRQLKWGEEDEGEEEEAAAGGGAATGTVGSTQRRLSRPVSVADTDGMTGSSGPRPRAVTIAGGMSLSEMQQAVEALSGKTSPTAGARARRSGSLHGASAGPPSPVKRRVVGALSSGSSASMNGGVTIPQAQSGPLPGHGSMSTGGAAPGNRRLASMRGQEASGPARASNSGALRADSRLAVKAREVLISREEQVAAAAAAAQQGAHEDEVDALLPVSVAALMPGLRQSMGGGSGLVAARSISLPASQHGGHHHQPPSALVPAPISGPAQGEFLMPARTGSLPAPSAHHNSSSGSSLRASMLSRITAGGAGHHSADWGAAAGGPANHVRFSEASNTGATAGHASDGRQRLEPLTDQHAAPASGTKSGPSFSGGSSKSFTQQGPARTLSGNLPAQPKVGFGSSAARSFSRAQLHAPGPAPPPGAKDTAHSQSPRASQAHTSVSAAPTAAASRSASPVPGAAVAKLPGGFLPALSTLLPGHTLACAHQQGPTSSLERAHAASSSHHRLVKHLSPLSQQQQQGDHNAPHPPGKSNGITATRSLSGVALPAAGPPPSPTPTAQPEAPPTPPLVSPPVPPSSTAAPASPAPPPATTSAPATPLRPFLPRTVYAAAAVTAAATAVAAGTLEADPSKADAANGYREGQELEELASSDPRAHWQKKLARLKNGQPVQPLDMLLASSSPSPPVSPDLRPAGAGGHQAQLASSSTAAAGDPAYEQWQRAPSRNGPAKGGGGGGGGGDWGSERSSPVQPKYDYYNPVVQDDPPDAQLHPPLHHTDSALTSHEDSLEVDDGATTPGVFQYQSSRHTSGGTEHEAPAPEFKIELDTLAQALSPDNGVMWKAQLREELRELEQQAARAAHQKEWVVDPEVCDPQQEEALARISAAAEAGRSAAEAAAQALADEAVRACPGGGGHSAGGQRSAKSGSDIQRLKEQLVDLSRQLEEEVEALRTAEGRLSMYVKRCNSSWAEVQTWQPPDLWGQEEVDIWLQSTMSERYRADTLEMLRNGQVAAQFFTYEDYIQLPDGMQQNLWCADPWKLLDTCRPGMAPPSVSPAARAGLTWGTRCLHQFVASVCAAVGSAHVQKALSSLHIIVHLDDEMQHEVVKDVWRHHFFGLRREHVLFVMQPRCAAHAYDSVMRDFVADETASDTRPPGTGLSLMQLAWACEAFVLDSEGAPEPVQGSVLEVLERANIMWLLGRRARDLSLLTQPGCLSPEMLAYAAFLREKARAGMLNEVMFADQLSVSRAMDSIVLGCKSVYAAWRLRVGQGVVSKLQLGSAQSVVELSHVELQGSELNERLLDLRTAMGGKVAVGCSRSLIHVPTLRSVLVTPALFRPKLQLAEGGEGLVHVRLHMEDLTAEPAMRCLGILARSHEWYGALLGPDQLEQLVPLLQVQDESPEMRRLLSSSRLLSGAAGLGLLGGPPTTPGAAAGMRRSSASLDAESAVAGVGVNVTGSGRLLPSQGGSRLLLSTIVVFAINNRVSQIAVDIASSIAKPGRHSIRLVTLVSSESQRADAEELLLRMYRSMPRTTVPVSTDVVARGEAGLLDCMESYLASSRASLVVLGSVHLTLSTAIGSVVLTLLRRLSLPMLVVTANSAKFADGSRPKLRIGMVVEKQPRELHSYLCKRIIDPSRGDTLMLLQYVGHKTLTTAQSAGLKRVLDSFVLGTQSAMIPVYRAMQLTGSDAAEALLSVVDSAAVNVLALPVTGHTIPAHVQNIIRKCKGAVLVFHEHQQPQQHLGAAGPSDQ